MIDEATQNPVGKHHDVDNIHVTRPDGTSRQASLRRLRKHAPSIHKEVVAGKLSANAGMVKAGLRKRTVTIPVDVETVEKFRASLESLFKGLTKAREAETREREAETRELAAYTITALVGAYRVGGYAEVRSVLDEINEVINSSKQEGAAKAR
jgi:hypothetical protein